MREIGRRSECVVLQKRKEVNDRHTMDPRLDLLPDTLFLPHPLFVFEDKKVKACYTGTSPQLIASAFVGG